mgnify:CR=1 FL=1
MKIVHCCLSCFYIDGYTYQENMLVREHVVSGHEVLVIASTETFNDEKVLSYVEPSEYVGTDGAKVIRLAYRSFLPKYVMTKLRIHSKLYHTLEDFKPDIIMFHGMCSFELLTVAQYVKKNPKTIFYADSHEDFNNSARSFMAVNSLYRLYYYPIIRLSKKYIEKVFYITSETRDFCKKIYRLSDEQMEFLPLGGSVLSDNEYNLIRQDKRNNMGVSPDEIVFFQSGKFDEKKKLLESVSSFSKIENDKFRFIIAGSLDKEVESDFKILLAKDSRITYIGWVESDELLELLCMCDVYVQPGSQSATMQMSVSARCSVILADVPSHRHSFYGNGFLVGSTYQLTNAFKKISNNPDILNRMSENSFTYAKENLDYSKLAKRLTK